MADVVGGVAVGVARHEEALDDGASAGAVFGVEPTAAVVEGFAPRIGGDGVPVVGEALLVLDEERVVVAVTVVGGVVPAVGCPRDVFVGVDGGERGSVRRWMLCGVGEAGEVEARALGAGVAESEELRVGELLLDLNVPLDGALVGVAGLLGRIRRRR